MIIRRAGPMDARAMAALLNEIIAIGGTTAKMHPIDGAQIGRQMQSPEAIWHLAETEDGTLKGFQYLELHPDLPEADMSIATFVKSGETGMGTGSRLFEVTRKAAVARGCGHLHAVIRADNAGGLAYYQSRGFEDFRLLPDCTLEDGTRADKVWKRYRL
ncbi:MAG: GNAT family N-acetyltransferase [Sulfitobacter sp.]